MFFETKVNLIRTTLELFPYKESQWVSLYESHNQENPTNSINRLQTMAAVLHGDLDLDPINLMLQPIPATRSRLVDSN